MDREFNVNPRQLELYNNLMTISSKDRKESPFYYIDQEVISTLNPEKFKNWKYRIFGYMLAQYSDWLLPDALWSRGTMFLINDKEEVQELTCLPMKKFFNLNENPLAEFSQRVLEEEVWVFEKLDGSLMSNFLDVDGNLRLKSKMSTKSEHCQKAMELLDSDKYKHLKSLLDDISGDFTVDLEWTSPNNRIVLGYEEDSLTVLDIRCKDLESGKTLEGEFHTLVIEGEQQYWAKEYSKSKLETVKEDKNIEGYIAQFKDGTKVKVKTEWYIGLHRVKNKISTPKNLYMEVLEERSDDLKSMFRGDIVTITQIEEMEKRASFDLSTLRNQCESYYQENKHLSRKDYAIKTTQNFKETIFGLCMNLYLEKDPLYKKYLIDRFGDNIISQEKSC